MSVFMSLSGRAEHHRRTSKFSGGEWNRAAVVSRGSIKHRKTMITTSTVYSKIKHRKTMVTTSTVYSKRKHRKTMVTGSTVCSKIKHRKTMVTTSTVYSKIKHRKTMVTGMSICTCNNFFANIELAQNISYLFALLPTQVDFKRMHNKANVRIYFTMWEQFIGVHNCVLEINFSNHSQVTVNVKDSWLDVYNALINLKVQKLHK